MPGTRADPRKRYIMKKSGASRILLSVTLSAVVMDAGYGFDSPTVKVVLLALPVVLFAYPERRPLPMEDMERKNSLRRSIVFTTTIYFCLQSVLFLAFAIPGGFLAEYASRFFPLSLGFHIALLAMLCRFSEDFVKESGGEKLQRINLANRVTLVRVSTLPTLMFLVVAAKNYSIRFPLLILVVIIFATDFLDGYISRKGNEVTRVGKMMDSASDYTLLFVLTLVFRFYSLIPTWFQLVVLARLSVQVLLQTILIAVKKRIEPKTTFMGKLAVASIMVAYTVEVLGLILGGLPQTLKSIIEFLVAAILVASVVDKVVDFVIMLGRGAKGTEEI